MRMRRIARTAPGLLGDLPLPLSLSPLCMRVQSVCTRLSLSLSRSFLVLSRYVYVRRRTDTSRKRLVDETMLENIYRPLLTLLCSIYMYIQLRISADPIT